MTVGAQTPATGAVRPGPDRGSRVRRDGAVDALLALAVGAALLAASMIFFPVMSLPPGWTPVIVAVFVVLHTTVALRRTAPVWGFGIASAAMLVVVLAPQAQLRSPSATGMTSFPVLFLPSSAVFLPVLYWASARRGRRAAAGFLTVAVGGALLAAARIDPAEQVGAALVVQYRVYFTFALVTAVSAAWGLGVWQAVRGEREAAARVEAARTAILADRATIARDMHDVVSHSLAVIVRQAEGGALLAGRSPERAAEVLRTIADVGRDALADMRGMVDVLRGPDVAPAEGDAPGAGPFGAVGGPAGPAGPRVAPPASLEDLPAVLDRVRGTGVEIDLHEIGTRYEIGPAAHLAAHHVVRETLTNVVKHAGPASRVRIELDWAPDVLHLTIRDEGCTGPVGEVAPVPGAGAGLIGLAERVAAAGGELAAEPLVGGFVVRAGFPRRDGGKARE